MDITKMISNLGLKELEKKLNISPEFIIKIRDEQTSWGFVSKFAQLIEGSFTYIIVQRLDEKNIHGTISNLSQAVRLNLACELKLITKEQKNLFLTIAEIRNDYMHNISNVEVSLFDYFENLKSSRRTEIYKRFKPFFETSIEEFFLNCEELIFKTCVFQLVRIYNEANSDFIERENVKFLVKQAEQLLPKSADDAITDKFEVLDYFRNVKKILKMSGLLK